MTRPLAAVACCLVLASSALAQVVYEPVRYQFDAGRGDQKYYYGGVDPRVHHVARRQLLCRSIVGGNQFDGGNSFGQPAPFPGLPQPVFTDCAPFQDVSSFGYSAVDARNEAYANAPTYFRKADLLEQAIALPDGQLIVPAAAPRPLVAPAPMRVAPYRGYGTTQPGQIMIIPKRPVDAPAKTPETKPLKLKAAR